MVKIKRNLLIALIWSVVIGLLIYSRFVNLGWGLPYPMHPDERNMAVAIQSLNCEISSRWGRDQILNCLNPHFFAYGQFPLYLGYFGIQIFKIITDQIGSLITFEEAVISLRLISAFASILNVFVLLRLVQHLINNNSLFVIRNSENKNLITNFQLPIISLVFIFSPFFIQFSHFGTTESLLMLLYSLIVYLSLLFFNNKILNSRFLIISSLLCGLAIGSKVSSVLFLLVPIMTLFKSSPRQNFYNIVKLVILSLIFSIVFSPHNFITFQEFLGSMKYEADVAMGNYRAFYTRLFDETTPILFQFKNIFPYVLGLPVFIFSMLGFLFLPYKKEINLLRFAIIAVFLPNAFLFAKWTRFMSPIFPFMLVFAILFIQRFVRWIPAFIAVTIIMVLPGLAYLSVYRNQDVRFTASEWIYKNIPENSLILSETANVIDMPILPSNSDLQSKNYRYISFNFYDLDQSIELQDQLAEYIDNADYIFIPTRRLFANHTCFTELSTSSRPKWRDPFQEIPRLVSLARNDNNELKRCKYLRKKFPILNDYYDKLFSGALGFEKVAEFTSYPKIELLGKTLFEIPDENAEETWTVFDHPVVRIYKRI